MKKLDRRSFLKKAGAGALALSAAGSLPFSSGFARGRKQSSRPNILVFVADDAGMDFGCYGNPYIQTPNIDMLAREGMKIEQAFLTCAQCSPSRTSMLTGQFPHTIGTEDLHTGLPEGVNTVMHYLRESGYFTGNILKSHIGSNGDAQFDWRDKEAWNDYNKGTWYEREIDSFDSFLSAADDDPFFMWVGFIDPHRPYGDGPKAAPEVHSPDDVVVPPYLADAPGTRKELAHYYDEIARMDTQIGKYIALLEEKGIRENTVIMFLSDNGAPFPRAKGTCYDAGLHTPLVVNWPGVIKPGTTHANGLVSTIDLAPTFLDIAGLPEAEEMYGESIKPIFLDPSTRGRDIVFSERNWHNTDEHMRSARTEQYRIIKNAYIEWPMAAAKDITTSESWYDLKRLEKEGKLNEGMKSIFRTPRPGIELYDLKNDPDEFYNVADDPKHVPEGEKVYKQLAAWMEETNDFPPHLRRKHDNLDRTTGFPLQKKPPEGYWYDEN